MLFKEKSALLKQIFIVQENLNIADFSMSNAYLKEQKSALLKENAENIFETKWNQRWFKVSIAQGRVAQGVIVFTLFVCKYII